MCWALCCLTASFSSAQSISASPADTTICEGDTAFLSVSGGGSYSWSPAVVPVAVDYSLVKAAPAATTTYTVTSINADGTTSSATATVNIKPPPEPVILYSSNVGCDSVHSADPGGQEGQHDCIQACDSSKVIYSTIAHPGSSYVWSVVGGTIVSGQNTDSICVLWGAVGNGSVTLTETDTCGNVGETELCIKIIESNRTLPT